MPLGLNLSYRNITFLITCAAALVACNQASEETAVDGSNPHWLVPLRWLQATTAVTALPASCRAFRSSKK